MTISLMLIFFLYMAVALEKDQIKKTIHAVAQYTYWFGVMLTKLPIKWTNVASSEHSVLNLEIEPQDFYLLMKLRADAIETKYMLEKVFAIMRI